MRRALAFLTPVGGPALPTPGSLGWFPVVGAAIGAAVGIVWWGASELWTAPVAAALVVAADLALTGLLHVDGLADSADGLLPPLDRERRLAVMADPSTGAFAVAVVASVLLLRFAALTAIEPSVSLLAGVWCASRTTMAAAGRGLTYARADGLATAFLDGRPALPVAAGGMALAAVLASAGDGWVGVAAVAGVVAGATAVLALAARRIGGFTGDVLGAAGVVGEACGLLVAAARW